MSESVGLVIGTYTWSPNNDVEVRRILELARKHRLKTLDTGPLYSTSESVIGQRGLASEFKIDTKATGVPVEPNNIMQSVKDSLKALQTTKVRTYFLHAPGEATSVEQQMEAIQELYRQGTFEKLGLSNFTRDEVVEYYQVAESNGYVLPSVYHCSYSVAARRNEIELFPTLRQLGISIQAYSPMDGGLLAVKPEHYEPVKGEWDPSTIFINFFHDLCYQPSHADRSVAFRKLSQRLGISQSGLAYRWARYHSKLAAHLGDEMILGPVTAEQLDHSLTELSKGPLPGWAVERLEHLFHA